MNSTIQRTLTKLILIIAVGLGLTGAFDAVLAQSPPPPFSLSITEIKQQGQGPIWMPVDFHLYSARTGMPPGFGLFSQTNLSLLPPPTHRLHPDLGVGPGAPHNPPYDSELAMGIATQGFVDKSVFTVSEFSGANGVYLSWMNVPSPGAIGSSPDFASGPIIPNTLFPIALSAQDFRNGDPVSSISFEVPPLDDMLSPPFNVDGHSHFPIFSASHASFLPEGTDPVGSYQTDVTMVDQEGRGWEFTVTFTIVEN